MTHQENYTFSKTFVIEELTQNGFDGIPEIFRVIMNNAMKAERDQFLQADKYERTEDRMGYANGYQTKDHQITCWRNHLGQFPKYGRADFILLPLRKECAVNGPC